MEIIQVSTSKQQSCETGRKLTQHVCLAMAEHNSDAVKKGRFCYKSDPHPCSYSKWEARGGNSYGSASCVGQPKYF